MVRGLPCLRYLAAVTLLLVGTTQAQPVTTSGQYGSSFPGACPLSKLSDVIITVVATQPESTTGPLSVRPLSQLRAGLSIMSQTRHNSKLLAGILIGALLRCCR